MVVTDFLYKHLEGSLLKMSRWGGGGGAAWLRARTRAAPGWGGHLGLREVRPGPVFSFRCSMGCSRRGPGCPPYKPLSLLWLIGGLTRQG